MSTKILRGALFAGAMAAFAACVPGEIDGDSGTGALCGSRGLPRCEAGEFCKFPIEANCGTADEPGTCTVISQICTREYLPVCGCDGRTYGNDCLAAAAGVSIEHQGACGQADAGADAGPPPDAGSRTCGGLLGTPCPDGQFCNFPIEAMCGAADQTGTCQTPPDACIAVVDPVCGCDGRTYGNACEAASTGVSVQAEGRCGSAGGGVGATCGGLLGKSCREDLFCNYPVSAQCGAADQTGTCRVRSDACTLQYDPVCGCDGKVYGNACQAAAAGVSIAPGGCE